MLNSGRLPLSLPDTFPGRLEGDTTDMSNYRCCITEYDEAKNNELLRAECLAEGKAEGKAEERYKLLGNLIRKGLLSEKQAAEEANVSVEEFRKLAAQFT